MTELDKLFFIQQLNEVDDWIDNHNMVVPE